MSSESDDEVMDEPAAGRFLKIGERTLRKLRQAGQIPYSRVGGQIRYLRSKLLQWLENGGTQQPKAGM